MNLNRVMLIVLTIGFFSVISLILSENRIIGLVQKIHSANSLANQNISSNSNKTKQGPITINLNSVSKTYNQSGQASVVDLNGKIKISLNLSEDGNLGTQLANIRMGTCENPGKTVYKLNNVFRGNSITTLNTALNNIFGDTPLVISINKSIYDNQDYTACGVLND